MHNLKRLSLFCLFWAAAVLQAGGAHPTTTQRTDIGGDFRLVDGQGEEVTNQDLIGAPVLLYFGFSQCPHICPTDLAKMAWVTNKVEDTLGIQLRPVFISLDPERDHGPELTRYVQHFHERFIGLTGSLPAITAAADQYHVYFKKIPIDDGDYRIDHSTFLFLLDDQGQYLQHFGGKLSASQIWQRMQPVIPNLTHGQTAKADHTAQQR